MEVYERGILDIYFTLYHDRPSIFSTSFAKLYILPVQHLDMDDILEFLIGRGWSMILTTILLRKSSSDVCCWWLVIPLGDWFHWEGNPEMACFILFISGAFWCNWIKLTTWYYQKTSIYLNDVLSISSGQWIQLCHGVVAYLHVWFRHVPLIACKANWWPVHIGMYHYFVLIAGVTIFVLIAGCR